MAITWRAVVLTALGAVVAGWLLGGPAGIGTLVYALLVGPSVQWSFKLFKVQPHKPMEVEMEAGIEGGAE